MERLDAAALGNGAVYLFLAALVAGMPLKDGIARKA